jgi:hypothetical protein
MTICCAHNLRLPIENLLGKGETVFASHTTFCLITRGRASVKRLHPLPATITATQGAAGGVQGRFFSGVFRIKDNATPTAVCLPHYFEERIINRLFELAIARAGEEKRQGHLPTLPPVWRMVLTS